MMLAIYGSGWVTFQERIMKSFEPTDSTKNEDSQFFIVGMPWLAIQCV